MVRINKKYFCAAAFLMFLFVTSAVTSCKDDDEAPQSYNFLESFGPCPVARGGELIFLGKDLSSVQSVEFPGGESAAPVFDGKGKFTVTVPASAQPGLLVLHTTKGDIKTVSEIGYSEPVTVKSFSPAAQRPGGEVTITGEYLSNATEIMIGSVKIDMEDAVSVTNTEIKFIVPAEAQTGVLALKDGQAVECGTLTVTVPVFSAWSKSEGLLPGTDAVTMSGSDLDLITSLTFGNGFVYNLENANVTSSAITFTVPAGAGDGQVTFSVASGLTGTASELAFVSPVLDLFGWDGTNHQQAETDTYMLGSEIVFTGKNLNLIKTLMFGNGSTEDFTVNADGTQITAKIPGTATDDQKCLEIVENSEAQNWGACYTSWKNAFVIRAKAFNGAEQLVGLATHNWGSNFWASLSLNDNKDGFNAWPGTDEPTEFIQSIIFEDKDVTEEFKTTGQVKVPLRVINSCPMTITLTNGTSKDVDCSSEDLRAGINFPVVATFPAGEVAGHWVEVTGWSFSTTTKFEFIKDGVSVEVTEKGFNNDKSYLIKLPQSLSGVYELKASDENGSSVYSGIEVAGSMAVLFEGSQPLGWDKTLGAWDLTGVTKLQITVKGNYGGWLGFMFQNHDGANLWGGQKDFGPADGEEFTLEVTGDDIPKDDNWYICGGTSGACNVIKVVAVY